MSKKDTVKSVVEYKNLFSLCFRG